MKTWICERAFKPNLAFWRQPESPSIALLDPKWRWVRILNFKLFTCWKTIPIDTRCAAEPRSVNPWVALRQLSAKQTAPDVQPRWQLPDTVDPPRAASIDGALDVDWLNPRAHPAMDHEFFRDCRSLFSAVSVIQIISASAIVVLHLIHFIVFWS